MLIWVGVENVGFFALLISWAVWLAVQVPKYRRSDGERRQQLKWLYSGAFVFVICLVVSLLQPNNSSGLWDVISAVAAPGIAALPIAVGIGILKYRLYEIDRIISRTLSYAIMEPVRHLGGHPATTRPGSRSPGAARRPRRRPRTAWPPP